MSYVKQSETQRQLMDLTEKVPGLKYIMPDPYDISSYITPTPFALSKGALASSLEKLAAKVGGPSLGAWMQEVAMRIPRKVRQSVGMLGTYKDIGKESYTKTHPLASGAIWSKHGSGAPLWRTSTKIGVDPSQVTPHLIPHEVGHEMFYMMQPEDRAVLTNAYDKLSKEVLSQLENRSDVSLHNASELFSETYGYYLEGSSFFKDYPAVFRHLAKKYHKLMR